MGLVLSSSACLVSACIVGGEGDYNDEQDLDELSGPTARA
jgi:hypothetical protein